MKKSLLITSNWYALRGGKATKNFDIFCQAYEYYCGSITVLSLHELVKKMPIWKTNIKDLSKFYGCLYVYDYDNGKKLVTGYWDLTPFLKVIKTNYDKDNLVKAIHEFCRYGGIVKLDEEVYVNGEESLLDRKIDSTIEYM